MSEPPGGAPRPPRTPGPAGPAVELRAVRSARQWPQLRLRPTMLSDLEFVQSVETDARNLPFITPWERTQHEAAVRIPDFRHFIVEAGSHEGVHAEQGAGESAGESGGEKASEKAGRAPDPSGGRDGFVILQGCRNPHGSVELKRIVLQRKGQGLGRACVRALKRMAFAELRAHRFWLDVKSLNTRALALYESEGFVVEGRLRESVRITGLGESAGYDTLIVMSLLDREYHARVALGLEARHA